MQFYSPIIIKFALGIICLIVQINLMGKGNLAPTSAMDQVQNLSLIHIYNPSRSLDFLDRIFYITNFNHVNRASYFFFIL